MGLAATQARLLTITSRLSTNELKQQNFANMKLRLASDQENLSLKYSDKLNNQTLQHDGKDITMDDLEKMGYTVMRVSDKQIAASNTTVTKTYYDETIKPTAPTCPTEARLSMPSEPVDRTAVNKAYFTDNCDKLKEALASFVDSFCNGVYKKCDAEGRPNGETIAITQEFFDQHSDTVKESKDSIVANARKLINNVTEQQYVINTDILNAQANAFANTGLTFENLTTGLKTAAQNLMNACDTTKANAETYFGGLKPDWNKTEAEYEAEDKAYKASVALWNKYDAEYAAYKTAYQTYLDSAVTTTEHIDENEVYTNCKNSQFLIQGLLNGYLALVKDGKVVSLDANADILTTYDKTDDAAAESEYEAEMNKINKKEKQIDQQVRKLETQYQALTYELNSIQNVLQSHTSKDFQLFS